MNRSGQRTTLLHVGMVFCWAPPATAQRFGQWWWTGSIGFEQRRTENFEQNLLLSRRDQQELRLSLGINGYPGHPALGRFRLGLDLHYFELESNTKLDWDRTGVDFNYDALPRSAFPFNLFFNRSSWDYASQSEDGFASVGTPDTATSWGATLRLRKWALRGLTLALSRSRLERLDPEIADETREREVADWTRAGRRIDHHARIEHTRQDLAIVDLVTEDLVFTVEERGDLSQNWYWQLSGTGIQRDLNIGSISQPTTETYRLRNLLTRDIRRRDGIDLTSTLTHTRAGAGPAFDSAQVGVVYRWLPSPGWQLSPFIDYARQSGADTTVDAPSAGLSATWNRQAGSLDALLTATAAWGRLERQTGDQGATDSSRVALTLGATLGLGRLERLRKELTVEASTSELRQDSDPLRDLPDLGLPQSIDGTFDAARARLALRHRWDSRAVNSWIEWSRRETSRESLEVRTFESEGLSGSLHFSGRRLTFQSNLGESRLRRSLDPEQRQRFVGASASWQPRRYIRLRASHRRNERQLQLIPDLEGDRSEVGATIRIGLFSFSGYAFESNERVEEGSERTNRGFLWSVSRGFAGWLPIVTGNGRRGTIR